MAREPVRKDIDGASFDIFPLQPKVALRILTRLTKVIGEPMGLLGDELRRSAPSISQSGFNFRGMLEQDMTSEGFAKAAKAFVSNLNENEVVETVELLLANVHGKLNATDQGTRQLSFDGDFAGRIPLLLKIVAASLEVNFGGFFTGSLGAAGAKPALA